MAFDVPGGRRFSGPWVAGFLAIIVLVVAVLLMRANGVVWPEPGDGPLEGVHNSGAQMPVPKDAEGVAFGPQTLTNVDGDERDITLRSVTVRGAHGGLTLLRPAYVFDHHRGKAVGAGMLVTTLVPLPEGWRDLPRHPLEGYVLRPRAVLDKEGNEDIEVMLEFRTPTQVAWLEGVDVEYDLDGRRHRVSFYSPLVLCADGTPEDACPDEPPTAR